LYKFGKLLSFFENIKNAFFKFGKLLSFSGYLGCPGAVLVQSTVCKPVGFFWYYVSNIV